MSYFVILQIMLLSVHFTRAVDGRSQESSSHCVMISVSETELKLLREIWEHLHQYLQMNMNSGHLALKNVLVKYGGFDLQVPMTDPLESHSLHLQLLLHQRQMDMFQRLENLFLKGGSSVKNDADGEVDIKTLGQETNKLRNIYKTMNLNAKKLGSLSPFALPFNSIYAPTDSHFRPHDCSDLLVVGAIKSGIYEIYPYRCTCAEPVKVYCDMESDGGGWTVFLSRMNQPKQLNFTRNWVEYRDGFGSLESEFYLGNEILHQMTSGRKYHLRMEAKDKENREVEGEWKVFSVNSAETKYQITITTLDATKGFIYDRLPYFNSMKFTTYDSDNDKNAKSNCAVMHSGGWWYNTCRHFNPTGIYGVENVRGIIMIPWSREDAVTRYAVWLQMKIRPAICSETVAVASLNTHNCVESLAGP